MSEHFIKGTIMITTAKFCNFYFYIIVSTASLIFFSFMHVLNILNIPKKTTDWLGVRPNCPSPFITNPHHISPPTISVVPQTPSQIIAQIQLSDKKLACKARRGSSRKLFFKCAVLSPCSWASLNLYTSQSTKMVALIVLSIVYLFTSYFN